MRVSHKSFPREFPTRLSPRNVPYKSVSQCPARVFHDSECPKIVFHKRVLQECLLVVQGCLQECPARVSDKSECPQHVLNAWGGYVALGTCLARSRLGYEFKARIAALIALATSLATPVCLFVC